MHFPTEDSASHHSVDAINDSPGETTGLDQWDGIARMMGTLGLAIVLLSILAFGNAGLLVAMGFFAVCMVVWAVMTSGGL